MCAEELYCAFFIVVLQRCNKNIQELSYRQQIVEGFTSYVLNPLVGRSVHNIITIRYYVVLN